MSAASYREAGSLFLCSVEFPFVHFKRTFIFFPHDVVPQQNSVAGFYNKDLESLQVVFMGGL